MKKIFNVALLLYSIIASAEDSTLKIKGLYINMPIDEACEVINNNWLPIFLQKGISEKAVRCKIARGSNGFYAGFGLLFGIYNIKADNNKLVDSIIFRTFIVNNLFNVADLNGVDFAQMFANSYNIPNMEPYESLFGTKG